MRQQWSEIDHGLGKDERIVFVVVLEQPQHLATFTRAVHHRVDQRAAYGRFGIGEAAATLLYSRPRDATGQNIVLTTGRAYGQVPAERRRDAQTVGPLKLGARYVLALTGNLLAQLGIELEQGGQVEGGILNRHLSRI